MSKRGRCSVCRAERQLLKTGLLRAHKDVRHEMYATGQDHLVPVCSGSGKAPAPSEGARA